MLQIRTRRSLLGGIAMLLVGSIAVGCAGNAAQQQLAREAPVREPSEVVEKHNAQGEQTHASDAQSEESAPQQPEY